MKYIIHYSVPVWVLDENGSLIPGDDLTLPVHAESKIKAVKAFKAIYYTMWGRTIPAHITKIERNESK